MANTRIEIILGPMFSGKSTEILRRTTRYSAIGKNVIHINHIFDTRTDDYIQTHNGKKEKAIKLEKLCDLLSLEEYQLADVIGVDEAQFFGDLIEFIQRMEKDNKILIIGGLDGDFQRKPFGQILYAIPYADEVIKLTAMDMISKDGTPAIFSKRIIMDNSQVSVGASDKYVAVSRKNYLN